MSPNEIELRRIVERIVRPVAAAEFRKQRMREELLAHVHAIFQQQVELSIDEPAAIAEAAKRLGDPGELSDSLQVTVPWYDRLWMFLQGETPPTVWKAGLRFAVVVNLAYFAALLPMFGVSLAYGAAPGNDLLLLGDSPLILPFLFLMPAWSLSIATVMWIMDCMQVQQARTWPPKNPGQLGVEIWTNPPLRIAALLGASAFVAAMLRVKPGSLDFVGITMLLCALLSLSVLVAWSLAQDVYAKRRQTQVWSSLVID